MPVSKLILLVDDDPDDRMLFNEAFKQVNNGFELVELKNGEELMQYLNNGQPVPKLIVMDFHMELMSGEEILMSIKNNKQLSRIPVIVYSGSSSCIQQDPILKLGANAYVQKPNTYEKMVDVVKSMMLLFAPAAN